MFKTGNYKIGFDIWGLTLFLAIMLPNFIWFAVPAVNDVLRNKSVTPLVDMIASVFQAVMVVALCVIVNKYCQKPMKKAEQCIGQDFLLLYQIPQVWERGLFSTYH